MDDNKWTYIIGIDLVIGIILCLWDVFKNLHLCMSHFFVMCISGIVGLPCLFSEEDRDTGYALLVNVLIIPFLFMILLWLASFMK